MHVLVALLLALVEVGPGAGHSLPTVSKLLVHAEPGAGLCV